MAEPLFIFQLAIDHSDGFDSGNGTLGTAALLRKLADILDSDEPGEGPWALTDDAGNKLDARYTSAYTVAAIYDNTGVVLCSKIVADDAIDAMRKLARQERESGLPNHLQILGAIPGEHRLTSASEDSSKAAYAADLAPITKGG